MRGKGQMKQGRDGNISLRCWKLRHDDYLDEEGKTRESLRFFFLYFEGNHRL